MPENMEDSSALRWKADRSPTGIAASLLHKNVQSSSEIHFDCIQDAAAAFQVDTASAGIASFVAGKKAAGNGSSSRSKFMTSLCFR
jgi:hypothetical protein